MIKKKLLVTALVACGITGVNADETPSAAEMWEIIQQQQKTIEQLKSLVNKNSKKVSAQEQAVTQTAQAVAVISENIDSPATNTEAGSKFGFGGYGELHYGNTDKGNSVDFHRFVLLNSYQFTDKTSFFSELEVEHALSGNGKPGEVEVEQAFIEHRFNDNMKMTAGVALLPIGIMNETHEPDTFYGVERNNVEKHIIPATWWSAGLGFSQEVSDTFAFDVYVGDGLNVPTAGANAFLIRKGRQKVAKAKANDGAITGRVRFNPINGLQLNASLMYQQDITQGVLDVNATLFTANAQYSTNGFTIKALYATWDLASTVATIAAGRDEQTGYYIEPSYRFGENNQYGVFVRYANWDNNAGDDDSNTDITQTDIGFNYWLTPRVVFKVDYQDQSDAKSDDGLHLGMGYSF